MRFHRPAVTLLASLATLAACGSDATAPAGLAVHATTPELREAQATALVATLDGRTVPAEEVAWTSRDTSSVVVRGTTATGRAPGSTWLVAQVGAERDSVRVVVRFPTLSANTMAARIAGRDGEPEHRFALAGASLQFERTGPVHTIIHAVAGRPANALPDDVFAGDTIVSIRFPGGLALGSKVLPPLEPTFDRNIGFDGQAGVFVAIEESEDGSSRAYYVAVEDATVEITALTLPDERGPGTGSVSGRMAFQAAGLRVRSPGVGQPLVLEPIGDRTFPVYVEFTTTLYRVPLSSGGLELTGTPYADTLPAGATARMTDAGLVLTTATLIDRDEPVVPTYFEPVITLPAPGLGTFSLADTTQARFSGFFAPFTFESGNSGAGTLGERATFASRTGTVVVTSYRAPTALAYGELVAEVNATLDFGSAHPEHRTTLSWIMRVPIRPLDGSVVP